LLLIGKYYKFTKIEGTTLKFLNYWIIQTDKGISLDQTEHIQNFTKKFFPLKDFKPCKTLMRTDLDFEMEFSTARPASSQDLLLFEKDFGGSFPSLYGSIQDIGISSRPNISFALMRIGYFYPFPNHFAFKCIKRVIRYLASYSNRPIYFRWIKDNYTTINIAATFGTLS